MMHCWPRLVPCRTPPSLLFLKQLKSPAYSRCSAAAFLGLDRSNLYKLARLGGPEALRQLNNQVWSKRWRRMRSERERGVVEANDRKRVMNGRLPLQEPAARGAA